MPWAKYKGEKHLPGHNFTGAQTDLIQRLDDNNNVKDNNYPINRVDAAAKRHDIFYRDHDDLSERHEADRRMIQELDAIQNPTMREKLERVVVKKVLQAKLKLGVGLPLRASKQEALNKLVPAGADSVMRLEQTAKSTPVEIKTKHELNKMTKLVNELHKSFRKPKHLRKIYFRSKDNIWNADLIIMPPENRLQIYSYSS